MTVAYFLLHINKFGVGAMLTLGGEFKVTGTVYSYYGCII